MFEKEINSIRTLFKEPENFIPLHEPRFWGKENEYVAKTIESTFVSSVGEYVDEAERKLEEITGAKKAVMTVNGTSALHAALHLLGAKRGETVITQALTFVATCNAISYLCLDCVFVDVSKESLNITPEILKKFLDEATYTKEGKTFLKHNNSRVRCLVVMHTFGFSATDIQKTVELCHSRGIKVLEDAAESLGSFYQGQHTGTFGDIGAVSFNGNKVVTSGGGGAIFCNDEELGQRAKHITTTAKVPHPYKYEHDEMGFNYRMPNLNAALLCAQLENLAFYLEQKRKLADEYKKVFSKNPYFDFYEEIDGVKANYWLNVLIAKEDRFVDDFLKEANGKKVMVRPVWNLMNTLEMYRDSFSGDLSNSMFLEKRIVNIPSSVLREI